MSEPQPLSAAISEYITRRGFARVHGNAQLVKIWNEIAGERIANKTKVLGLNRSVLEIAVSNAALLNELVSFYQQELLDKIKVAYPDHKIGDLKFKLKSDLNRK